MSRIFISYKRVDKEKVLKIKDRIESALGEKCWMDIDGIESGAVFADKIIGAINNCEIFLFMYSKNHIGISDYENDWTIRELNFAQEKKKRIVFINIDKSELTDWFKLLFGTKQRIDGTSNEAVSRLIEDLRKWLVGPLPPPPSSPTVREKANRYFKKHKIGCYITASIVILAILISVSACLLYPQKTEVLKTEVMPDEIKAVDLGLPSGKLWANKNIGASGENIYGDLYSWGDTITKHDYGEAMYKEKKVWNIAGTSYDVATNKLGKEWSIPTAKDFNELMNNCKWQWIVQGKIKGFKVTGKNGNSIFLPASGWNRSSRTEYRNLSGYYWTSDKVDGNFAKGLLFGSTNKRVGRSYLYYGRSVRAIKN